MAFTKANGDVVDKTAFGNLVTENAQPATYTVPENIYETFPYAGSTSNGRRLRFHAGQQITKAEFDS